MLFKVSEDLEKLVNEIKKNCQSELIGESTYYLLPAGTKFVDAIDDHLLLELRKDFKITESYTIEYLENVTPTRVPSQKMSFYNFTRLLRNLHLLHWRKKEVNKFASRITHQGIYIYD